jgi:hypothetical protein
MSRYRVPIVYVSAKRGLLVVEMPINYKCFKAGQYQNIWTSTRGRRILHNKGMCDLVMSPAMDPRKEDPRTVGVTGLEASSIVPVVFTYGLRQQAYRLVACEGCHNQHPSEQNRMAG